MCIRDSPYIWKQLGTDCRNLPQVHIIVRMIRMITEIVCPGVVLLGEVVMEPAKVVPVSYTHLDVYKRQDYAISSWAEMAGLE